MSYVTHSHCSIKVQNQLSKIVLDTINQSGSLWDFCDTRDLLVPGRVAPRVWEGWACDAGLGASR